MSASDVETLHDPPEEILREEQGTGTLHSLLVALLTPPLRSGSSLSASTPSRSTFHPSTSDSHPALWSFPTSTSSPPLHHPIPTKPRSNSQLQPIRPAPPSPAPSRPTSQILSPRSRDRSGSTSSRGGRRVSGTTSRTSSKPRPRSTLGASPLVLGGTTSDTSEVPTPLTEGSLATSPIPEHLPSPPTLPQLPELVIRDYAYPSSDSRYHLSPIPPPSHRGSQDVSSSPGAGSSDTKKGWGGFNLLSWRGFMGKSNRDSLDSNTSSQRHDETEDDYPLPVPDDDNDDDYAFSSTSSEEEEEEPWGLYKAAFPFEAMGEPELGLEEGDYVEVRGRGGGEGWVVAVRKGLKDGKMVSREGGSEKEGLVPESYLEKVEDSGLVGREEEKPAGIGPEARTLADVQ